MHFATLRGWFGLEFGIKCSVVIWWCCGAVGKSTVGSVEKSVIRFNGGDRVLKYEIITSHCYLYLVFGLSHRYLPRYYLPHCNLQQQNLVEQRSWVLTKCKLYKYQSKCSLHALLSKLYRNNDLCIISVTGVKIDFCQCMVWSCDYI